MSFNLKEGRGRNRPNAYGLPIKTAITTVITRQCFGIHYNYSTAVSVGPHHLLTLLLETEISFDCKSLARIPFRKIIRIVF